MKKDDIVARDVVLEIGTTVLQNVTSPETAKAFMETDFFQEHDIVPSYEIRWDTTTDQNAIFLTQAVIRHEEAQVNWVIDGECAVKYKDGHCRIFTISEEPEWRVMVESVPSYQSSVENMSDEDLRKIIDDLRTQRTFITTRPKRTMVKKETIDKNDPIAVALASMPPEKKLEIMKKLGMVE